jgi:hypothetical protein
MGRRRADPRALCRRRLLLFARGLERPEDLELVARAALAVTVGTGRREEEGRHGRGRCPCCGGARLWRDTRLCARCCPDGLRDLPLHLRREVETAVVLSGLLPPAGLYRPPRDGPVLPRRTVLTCPEPSPERQARAGPPCGGARGPARHRPTRHGAGGGALRPPASP